MKNHAKGFRSRGYDDPGGMSLSSDFETHLSKVPLCGKDQRGKSRKRLEGPEIRIGSFSERRFQLPVLSTSLQSQSREVGEVTGHLAGGGIP